jgi:hemoglobin-like flavoprotein
MFYQRLFELDPSLRPLFTSDLRSQGAKLMATLALAVNGLSRPESIVPAVQSLGRRHVGYGVQPAHYQIVGQALLDTLATALGDQYTVDVADAWTAAYSLLAGVMQEAAASPVAH